MKKLYLLFYLLSLVFFTCNSNGDVVSPEVLVRGVSKELADYRSENVSSLSYDLHFNLPAEIDKQVTGDVEIRFMCKEKTSIIVDFTSEVVGDIVVNGELVECVIENEHIIIPKKSIEKGENSIFIEFKSEDRSLNRRDDFMYTLLVPDRARTLFPLFDQPNLKAKYTLSLTQPEEWIAISNSSASREETAKETDGYTTIYFEETEPISSYLFSFVAGVFEYVTTTHKGREHKIYHREKNEANIKQFDAIFNELFVSLDWLEEYTGVKYPFSKYDMVLIPGFQYGGMEHIGSTIYNAKTMFLSPTPTINERVRRAKLVAHETAHMWFGDLVTMAWFDDVWTKEVFANYFAAKIIAPLFPELDEKQGMITYFTYAYDEDRTVGATAVRQELDNMQYAGLVYNNIIYNKSPIILNMIANMMGEAPFRMAICEVLKKHAYSSASWEDWIMVFDSHTDIDLVNWNKSWMYEKGMPHISIKNIDNEVTITQADIRNKGVFWEQKVTFRAISAENEQREYTINLKDKSATLKIDFTSKYIIPNSDGNGYGYFEIDDNSANYLMDNFSDISSSVERRITLINLYNNVLLDTNIKPELFIESMLKALAQEKDALVFSTILDYINNVYKIYTEPRCGKESYKLLGEKMDKSLWDMFNKAENPSIKATTFKTIYLSLFTQQSAKKIYDYWQDKREPQGVRLGERDYIDMSLYLAIYYPERADEIVDEQLKRIYNPDLKREYEFVSKAVAPTAERRDIFFKSLLKEENRSIERWTLKALGLLTKKRDGFIDRNSYIAPALEVLPTIQQTGDIFFPQQWCTALLKGYNNREAYIEVNKYLKNNTDLHPMLKSKLLIAAGHLYVLCDDE